VRPPYYAARFRSRRFTFNVLFLLRNFGRGGRIRTADPLLPKQMRYQAALRPDRTEHGFFYRLLADTARILRFRKTEQCGNIREFRDKKKPETLPNGLPFCSDIVGSRQADLPWTHSPPEQPSTRVASRYSVWYPLKLKRQRITFGAMPGTSASMTSRSMKKSGLSVRSSSKMLQCAKHSSAGSASFQMPRKSMLPWTTRPFRRESCWRD
jgi:hypothetical protein